MSDQVLRRSSRNTVKRNISVLEEISKGERLCVGHKLPDDLPLIETQSGEKVAVHDLVKGSDKGIVIFSYPKASTPGCTTQACLFRDSAAEFKQAGYTIYGLSGDKPAANQKFKQKNDLIDLTLLSDPTYELHQILGIKKHPRGTIRSTIVINKDTDSGIVILNEPSSPKLSVEKAKKAVSIVE
ncbi:thioredoxin-like protein [Geopyxis carbonaria]|nr:thioredoxin-like protein [Geopyxis carbonaria]